MSENNERRKHPRIKDTTIDVKLSGDGFNAITQSLDISASGIYCKVPNKLPVMTRIQVILTVPNFKKNDPPVKLNIDGIVVREHPVKKDGKIQHYDVAIFFNMLMPAERELLIKYIDKKIK
jgi:PilZ domain-containing protein